MGNIVRIWDDISDMSRVPSRKRIHDTVFYEVPQKAHEIIVKHATRDTFRLIREELPRLLGRGDVPFERVFAALEYIEEVKAK